MNQGPPRLRLSPIHGPPTTLAAVATTYDKTGTRARRQGKEVRYLQYSYIIIVRKYNIRDKGSILVRLPDLSLLAISEAV